VAAFQKAAQRLAEQVIDGWVKACRDVTGIVPKDGNLHVFFTLGECTGTPIIEQRPSPTSCVTMSVSDGEFPSPLSIDITTQ
jgi:hypothetical protein